MPTQSELIGNHPAIPNEFARLLECTDVLATVTKCHRGLKEIVIDEQIIDWFARLLIKYHYTDYKLARLKTKFTEAGFPKYAAQSRRLPIFDDTKKGNGAEVLLVEYVKCCLKTELINIERLKYNTNVDQSMKGDDSIIIQKYIEQGVEKIKIYLGESKFRTTPDKKAVNDILKSLSKDKIPLSYTFLIEVLAKNADTKDIADKLDDILIEDVKNNNDLIYTGLLFGNMTTFRTVERLLKSDNTNLVFISLSLRDPESFINTAFEKATQLISEGKI